MAGVYEEAFKKWLGQKPESKGGGDHTPSHQDNKMHLEDIKNSKLQTNFAPVLFDDDDDGEDDQTDGDYLKHLGTGPPVLEPVIHHPHRTSNSSDEDCYGLEKPSSLKEYSRFGASPSHASQKTHNTLERPVKTYSAYGNTHKSPQKRRKPEIESQVTTKPSSGGNIFDKFSPATGLYIDDSPPPLIPSPKVMTEDQKLSPEGELSACAGKSPDFCAMEADSTSELQGCQRGQDNPEKSSVGSEMCLECDSTCMLGGSPAIVSPASNSTGGDMEETRDSGDGFKKQRSVEIQCNPESLEEKPAMPVLTSDSSVFGQACEGQVRNATDKDGMRFENKSVGQDFMTKDTATTFLDEPPILTTHTQQHTRRKHRHTVDDAEGLSKSRRISASPPPPLIPVQGDGPIYLSSSNQGSSKGKKRKSSQWEKKQSQSLPTRHQYVRSNTVPVVSGLDEDSTQFVRATWQLSQLQIRMHTLLSRLWPRLQLDKMTPESQQFCRLLADVVSMLERPDIKVDGEEAKITSSSMHNAHPSSKPVKHVVSTLPTQPNQSSHASPLSDEQQSRQASSDFYTGQPQAALSSHQTFDDHELSNHHPLPQPAKLAIRKSEDSPSLAFSPGASDSLLSQTKSSTCEQQQQQVVIDTASKTSTNQQNQPPCLPLNTTLSSSLLPLTSPSNSHECPLLDLSQLTLADTATSDICLRPVSVVLPRDPELALDSYACLVCRALQLLLPDITVSLTNELSPLPQALTAFIDNVLAVNIRRSHKKKS